jgi:hypothetical protein
MSSLAFLDPVELESESLPWFTSPLEKKVGGKVGGAEKVAASFLWGEE